MSKLEHITTEQEAKNMLGSWNGKDEQFIHEGEVYHCDVVYELEAMIEQD